MALGFMWLISVLRFAIAFEKNEPMTLEPALAALLSVAPPVALLRREVRDALFSDA